MFLFLLYSSVSSVCIKEEIEQGRSYDVVNADLMISNCFFRRLLANSNDGSIIMISNSNLLKITDSMFYNCRTSASYGGAIHASCVFIEMNKICVNECASSYAGMFLYASIQQNITIEATTVTKSRSDGNGYHPIMFGCLYSTFNQNNFSNNYCYHGSSICSTSNTDFSSGFCTLSNDRSSNSIVLFLVSDSVTSKFEKLNLLNNSQNTQSYGIIYSSGFSTFNNCFFSFNSDNILFYCAARSISVTDCFISHSSSFLKSGSVSITIIYQTPEYAFNHAHFKSYYCFAEYELTVKMVKSMPKQSCSIILLQLLIITFMCI